jgi:hypothetical protein
MKQVKTATEPTAPAAPAPVQVKVRVLKTISHAGHTLARGAEFTTWKTTADAMVAAGDAEILSSAY